MSHITDGRVARQDGAATNIDQLRTAGPDHPNASIGAASRVQCRGGDTLAGFTHGPIAIAPALARPPEAT